MSNDATHEGPDTQAPADPKALVRESIKYRRRAQDAERRVEDLEAEVRALREAREADTGAQEQEAAALRAETDSLRGELDRLRETRRLERALATAGCADAETALALARERIEGEGLPEDPEAFARDLLAEKPHLRTGPAGPAAVLPPQTAGARPSTAGAGRREADRLADRARQTGRPADVAAYMRARRGAGR